jgi:pectin methylesterase-like acyl-CoA thioesterase
MKHIFIFILLFICTFANAQPFRFIVAVDGSGTHTTVQSAIDACPDNERSIIFVKNGNYPEQVSIGSKAAASLKKISIIGESTEGVVITNSAFRSSANGLTFEDICTFKIYAKDFYAENITIQNTAGNVGQAEALFSGDDRQTFKNCRISSYQDTYRSKKGIRGYFKNSTLEGAIDFIYAGGIVFFDDCTINCVKGGGYITAPEDAFLTIPKSTTASDKFLRVGFFFRHCDITANTDVPDNSYYLGRPWNTMAGSFYINCRLGKHIHTKGWKEWNGNETSSSFAEFNSVDFNGQPADISGRASWSFQLATSDVENLLTPAAIYARITGEAYNPEEICVSPPSPNNVNVVANELQWGNVENAAGYIVFKNGSFLAAVQTNSYADNSGTTGIYTIKSVGNYGQLSLPANITSTRKVESNPLKIIYSDKSIRFSRPVTFSVYNVQGVKLVSSDIFSSKADIGNIPDAGYIVKTRDEAGSIETNKLIITQ